MAVNNKRLRVTELDFDNIKDNLNIIRDPTWDDDWIKDERQPEETS